MQMILAEGATEWNGPAWIIILVVLSSILSFCASLGVGLILYRSRSVDERLARGDAKFDEIIRDQANIAVKAAIDGGEIQKSMWRDFVSYGAFESFRRDMIKAQGETTRVIAGLDAKMDTVCLKIKEISRAA